MTRIECLFVWIGGAMFVASLALTAWWYGVFLGQTRPFAGWLPLVFDAALFSVFALHHSLFARAGVKAALDRIIPERLLRSTYVWTASVLLMLVCLLWSPIGGELYRDDGWPAFIHGAIQVVGLGLILQSVRAIDALELAGIRPAFASSTLRPDTRDHLQVGGPYRLVRHPLYFGWLLVLFGVAHMTGDRLAFAVTSSLYLVVAIPWEERALCASFGDEYARYQRRVRWRIVPGIW